jgi:DNA repair protein RecO (recombination protein O)
MEKTVKGILIHTIRHTDSNFIVRIYTRNYGLKSFIIRSGKTPKTSVQHLLQPLALLEFESHIKEQASLQQLKSLRIAHALQAIPFETGKSAIVLFLDEVLYKTIPDDYENDALFTFLWDAVILLDDAFSAKNFHLWCLLEITRYFGFYPQYEDNNRNNYFDLLLGQFVGEKPLHQSAMEKEQAQLLMQLLDKEWPQVQDLELHSEQRKILLDHLVLYIRIHLENLREIKSLHVLHEVFH